MARKKAGDDAGSREATSAAPFAPTPVLRVSDLETLRVLADPLRMRILEAFDTHPGRAVTVKALARDLDQPVTKLYYHVNLLEERGLLVVVGRRLVSGIVEKSYRAAAELIVLDRSILGGPAAEIDGQARSMLDAIFDTTRHSLEASLRSGRARIGEGPEGDRVLMMRTVEMLTGAAAADARRQIEAMGRSVDALSRGASGPELGARVEGAPEPDNGPRAGAAPASGDGTASEATRPYGLLVVFYPLQAEVPDVEKRDRDDDPA